MSGTLLKHSKSTKSLMTGSFQAPTAASLARSRTVKTKASTATLLKGETATVQEDKPSERGGIRSAFKLVAKRARLGTSSEALARTKLRREARSRHCERVSKVRTRLGN